MTSLPLKRFTRTKPEVVNNTIKKRPSNLINYDMFHMKQIINQMTAIVSK